MSGVDLADGIAWSCVAGGVLMMILGTRLPDPQKELRDATKDALIKVTEHIVSPGAAESGSGIGGTARQQSALVGSADFVKGLAELAKGITGLSRPIQAFVVSVILFFFAGTLAAVHTLR